MLRRSRRAVSDVVATILILALTVTLFASIFGFVTSFPSPPPQNTSEFQASLVVTSNQSYISGVSVLHLSGPVLPTSDKIFLQSTNSYSEWQFSLAGGVPVAWGLNPPNVTAGWNLGEYWSTSFKNLIKIPDNITLFIVSPKQLLYTVVLPGIVSAAPPAIEAAGVTPSTPGVGAAFQIYAQLAGNLTGAKVTVALGGVPGLTGTPTMVQYSGEWVYNVSAGKTTSNGTYYVFISVTNGAGQTASTSVVVPITGSGGGGGGGPGSISVDVGLSQQPPIYPLTSGVYFWAAVSYSGGSSNVPVAVTFWLNQTPLSPFWAPQAPSCSFSGSPNQTITGPSTITVYSTPQPTFPSAGCANAAAWLFNATVKLQALAVLTGIGSAVGSASFATPNTVQARVYTTNSSAGAFPFDKSFAHTCPGPPSNTCPYLYLQVWNNYTTALGGPSSLSFAGVVTFDCTSGAANCTGALGASDHSASYSIASTSVTQGASTLLNVVGGANRLPVTVGTVPQKYTLTAYLTVSSGATVVGHIFVAVTILIT